MPVLPGQSQGHGYDIGTLGPSDTSDSGSDMKGVPGRRTLQRSDPPEHTEGRNDLSDLADEGGSDSDLQGTGEGASVDIDDGSADGANIDVDRIESIKPEQ